MEDANNNWDLHAVVRGCRGNASTSLYPFCSYVDSFLNEEVAEGGEDGNSFFPDLETTRKAIHELEELCNPFFSNSRQLPQEDVVAGHQQPGPETQQRVSENPRSKRRKNQQKKVVCQVPADGLSSDMWAWRKYGQKPIKGSPYPRGYYRCSSSKGCLARKQVERSRTDPTMLILTYTAEHNHPVPTHRNSLAGSTRCKFPPLPSRDNPDKNLASNSKSSSPLSASTMTGLSPTTSLTASMEDELLMPNDDVEEENGDDAEEDMVSMDSEKFGGDDEEFLKEFFSDIWQVDNSTVAGAGVR